MSQGLLLDTHAIIWFLFKRAKLSTPARLAIERSEAAGERIQVSTISIIEVIYLIEKSRLPESEYEDLVFAFHDPTLNLELLSVDLDVALAVERIPRDVVPDLPDRIIAATALTYNLPLVTADHQILRGRHPDDLVAASHAEPVRNLH